MKNKKKISIEVSKDDCRVAERRKLFGVGATSAVKTGGKKSKTQNLRKVPLFHSLKGTSVCSTYIYSSQAKHLALISCLPQSG